MTEHFVPTFPSVDYASFNSDELDHLHDIDGKLRLFNNIACPFGQRALWTALETKAPFQVVEVSLKNQPDSYHEKFNRYGTVPYLLDNGFAVHESAIVANYIDVMYGNGQLHRLFDPQAASIAQLAIAKYEPRPFYSFLSIGDEKSIEVKEVLQELETIYSKNAHSYRIQGPYLLGADLSSAEINLFPFFYRFEIIFGHYRKWNDFLADYPTLKGAFEAVKARSTFQQTILGEEFTIQQYASRITVSP